VLHLADQRFERGAEGQRRPALQRHHRRAERGRVAVQPFEVDPPPALDQRARDGQRAAEAVDGGLNGGGGGGGSGHGSWGSAAVVKASLTSVETLPSSPPGQDPRMELTRPAMPDPNAARGDRLLGLAERRLGWLDRRQSVLAGNVANSDTPGFRPRDLAPFRAQLDTALRPTLARSHPAHLARSGGAPDAREDRRVGEAVPDGNAVSLDREAMRIAETDTAHALAMAVHRSFTGMFRLTLGR
jgi:flagellar basal-body rod protein FlgB